jgi:hypothetical protein
MANIILPVAAVALIAMFATGGKKKKSSGVRPPNNEKPAQPADPAEPAAPSQPVDPAQPADPSQPPIVGPADPYQPFEYYWSGHVGNMQEMQEALIDLGFSVGPFGADGNWGKNTKAAVKSFQIYVNNDGTPLYDYFHSGEQAFDWDVMVLREDGEPDRPTLEAINEAMGVLADGYWIPPGGA